MNVFLARMIFIYIILTPSSPGWIVWADPVVRNRVVLLVKSIGGRFVFY